MCLSEFCLIIELWRACCLYILCLLSAVEWKLHNEMRHYINMWYISLQIQWAVIAILLCALGWRDQCQLLYHKWCCDWSSWWKSYEACCCFGGTQLDSVNVYFIFYANSYWTISIWRAVINTNNKLSCHRETLRRLVSLNILLSHSSSLTVIWNDTLE